MTLQIICECDREREKDEYVKERENKIWLHCDLKIKIRETPKHQREINSKS